MKKILLFIVLICSISTQLEAQIVQTKTEKKWIKN